MHVVQPVAQAEHKELTNVNPGAHPPQAYYGVAVETVVQDVQFAQAAVEEVVVFQ